MEIKHVTKQLEHLAAKQQQLNNQLLSEKIKKKLRKYLETHENGNTTHQNLSCYATLY